MKERLDVLLVKRGLFQSRAKAQAVIKEGGVTVNGKITSKPGVLFDDEKDIIAVTGDSQKYVSRGGLKLEKAIEEFKIDLTRKVCMDIGSSTGGFTDCMLCYSAAKVYAIDVGTDQLDARLRDDKRVISMEQTNFRYVTKEQIGEAVDFAAADVSFISLDKILSNAYMLLKDGGLMVCLIKPQFEAGRQNVGKGGIVRDKKIHEAVKEQVQKCAESIGFVSLGLTESPILGGDGNTEYLILLKKEGARDNE